MSYRDHFSTRSTSQTEVIPGREADMKANNGGGVSFQLDKWKMLERFLILGAEKGTYYVSEKKLTKENGHNILACLKENANRTIDTIIEISVSGRAPRNDAALFALAVAFGTVKPSRAKEALSKVARTGTHLFHFLEYVEGFRGWGSALKKEVASWYLDKEVNALEYQVIKYKQRDGWSHRDALRLSHPKTSDPVRNNLFKYIVKGEYDAALFPKLRAISQLSRMNSMSHYAHLIREHHLPWEVIPDALKDQPVIWEALLDSMPIMAIVRNLNKMTSIGLLTHSSAATQLVVNKLTSKTEITRSRIHPIQALVAQKTYQSGRGVKGKLSWTPVPRIVEALEDTFHKAFSNVEPSGKRILYALDVSGSMSGETINGMNMSAREASGALALVAAQTEEQYQFMAFSGGFIPLNITRRDTLSSVMTKISGLPFNNTNCALPMIWANDNNLDFDAFVVYTDSETNTSGSKHAAQELVKYRQKRGIQSKLIVVGMTATDVTIADPNDAGMLDVVGFDSNGPAIINDFIRH